MPRHSLARRLAAALPAAVAAAAAMAALPAPLAARPADAAGLEVTCDAAAELASIVSPMVPWKGAPLRIVVTAEKPLAGELALVAPDGRVAVATRDRSGGPPWHWHAEVAEPQAGKWQLKLSGDLAGQPCSARRDIVVARANPGGPGQRPGMVWPLREAWSRANESLYSAWIERLFDAPLEASPSWKALHEVLRDRSRNLLHNHLGLREDEKGIEVKPDCADLPYFLRAYFAFKMGLPFGYAKCTRGGGGRPPRCPQWWNVMKEEPQDAPPEDAGPEAGGGSPGILGSVFGQPPRPKPARTPRPAAKPKPQGLAPAFGAYLQTIGESVHSGSARTAASDEETDYYPVPLDENTLRPGTVYADPYGHLLVVAKRMAQTGERGGILLAVDGQPDGTVARKRFWRGNFLFAQDAALGSPGFKRFRPVLRDGGGLRRLSNREIARSPAYGDFSLDQSKLDVEGFYDRMDDVISPTALDPERALVEAIDALEEQVKARVTSVENGRKHQLKGGPDVGMPDGAAIFETTGAWEDFATPSRDLRLLIAMDVVRGFTGRVERRPDRYAMPKTEGAESIAARLDAVLARELARRDFKYTRSDGSQWTLTLAKVIERVGALEVAYNVNDCVETRWGAAEGSEEAQTCRRRAPESQQRKMADVRAWFKERRRPPRG